MWFDDFRALIRRNQSSNANVQYYRVKDGDPLKISIFDRGFPRRNPDTLTFVGYGEHDHWKDSFICAAAFFGGEIPMEGSNGTYEGDKCIERPYRGALAALIMLIQAGSLRRTDELRDLFRNHGRILPKPTFSEMAPYFGHSSDLSQAKSLT